MITSPIDTFTNATPTDGDTPRASLMAQITLWASFNPRLEEVPVVRDFRPEAVPMRVPGRAVEGLEVLGLVINEAVS
jgi:hypothetical protein